MTRAAIAAAVAAMATARMASSQAEPERAPAVTQHSVSIGGTSLPYTAEAGRLAIRNVETGEPHAYMFYASYRVASPGKRRPVTFIWNGGPGWPALPLHFEVAGPLRGDGERLVENADTWLTESDLVFVDPVGTGFSRATRPEYVKEFALLVGDVMAETEFIRCWLLQHDAEDAPVIIAGESYGSSRAGRVAYQALTRGVRVAGIAHISGGTDLPSFENANTVDWAMHAADMAVVGLYFKRTPPELGSTPDAVRAATERWVRERYLPALARIDSLSDTERNAIAAELSAHTGYNTDQLDRRKLILSSQAWFGAFPVDGKRALVADFRRSTPVIQPWIPAAIRYLRRDLGYRTDLPYVGMDGGETLEQGFAPNGKYPATMNARWVHSAVYDPTPEQFAEAQERFNRAGMLGIPQVGSLPSTPDAIRLNPKLRVFVAQGAYDPLGGCSINSERARRLQSPYREVVQYRCYDGAHQMYLDVPARTLFSNDMKAFIHSAASAQTADPRVGLRAGWMDAGQAISNMRLVSSTPRPAGFFDADNLNSYALINSDLAFTKNFIVQGSFHGFLIWDATDPAHLALRTAFVCPGGQMDPSIYGNLLFLAVEMPGARVDCGAQGVRDSVSRERFKGVRIFDIRDIDHPRQIAAVQTCRGAHTQTLLTDPKDPANIYIYGSGTFAVRSPSELAGCSAKPADQDTSTSLFRIDVIRVPLAAPEKARVISSPRLFADAGRIAGLWMGGNHGEGTQTTQSTDQCHDITAYQAIGLAAGACSGNGLLVDITKPSSPKRIAVVSDANFAYWHSATFNNDGTSVVFTDEWGGGQGAKCRATDRRDWGADAIFTLSGHTLTPASYYKLPAVQTPEENCVAHNGSLIPVPGRDIMVQAWYQGGISVVDFTDAAHPFEIAYFDRGPVDSTRLVSFGGSWAAYWYNGHIVSSEIARGIDILSLVPSAYLSPNELEAANLVRFDVFNAQTQPKFVWPASYAVARAYLDQLARNDGLSPDRRGAVEAELDRTEKLRARERRTPLDKLAALLRADALAAHDAKRVGKLADAVAALAKVQ